MGNAVGFPCGAGYRRAGPDICSLAFRVDQKSPHPRHCDQRHGGGCGHYSREADTSSTTPIFQRPGIYTYYALIRYSWQGIDRKVRLNLPLSPSTYQLFKGRAAELLVLDSTAGKPLLRTVYLDPIGLRRQSLPVGRRS